VHPVQIRRVNVKKLPRDVKYISRTRYEVIKSSQASALEFRRKPVGYIKINERKKEKKIN